MPTYNLTDYATTRLALGRASIWVAGSSIATAAYWDESAPLELSHLGITMEEVGLPEETPTNELTLPELTGAAPLEAYVENPRPVIEFTAIITEPDQLAALSPVGSASRGHRRPPLAKKHTLVLFPEALLVEGDPPAEVALSYTSGSWTVGGDAATAEQLELIGLSVWFWKGFFEQIPIRFRYDEGGRAETTVRFVAMQDLTKPNGEQIWTVGDPANAGIDIEATGS